MNEEINEFLDLLDRDGDLTPRNTGDILGECGRINLDECELAEDFE